MQRQALKVSPKELRKLADELEQEYKNTSDDIGIPIPLSKKSLVPIINKTGCSDEWMFE